MFDWISDAWEELKKGTGAVVDKVNEGVEFTKDITGGTIDKTREGFQFVHDTIDDTLTAGSEVLETSKRIVGGVSEGVQSLFDPKRYDDWITSTRDQIINDALEPVRDGFNLLDEVLPEALKKAQYVATSNRVGRSRRGRIYTNLTRPLGNSGYAGGGSAAANALLGH